MPVDYCSSSEFIIVHPLQYSPHRLGLEYVKMSKTKQKWSKNMSKTLPFICARRTFIINLKSKIDAIFGRIAQLLTLRWPQLVIQPPFLLVKSAFFVSATANMAEKTCKCWWFQRSSPWLCFHRCAYLNMYTYIMIFNHHNPRKYIKWCATMTLWYTIFFPRSSPAFPIGPCLHGPISRRPLGAKTRCEARCPSISTGFCSKHEGLWMMNYAFMIDWLVMLSFMINWQLSIMND